jgi:hypothetical protein
MLGAAFFDNLNCDTVSKSAVKEAGILQLRSDAERQAQTTIR